jgi:hypothetical protein
MSVAKVDHPEFKGSIRELTVYCWKIGGPRAGIVSSHGVVLHLKQLLRRRPRERGVRRCLQWTRMRSQNIRQDHYVIDAPSDLIYLHHERRSSLSLKKKKVSLIRVTWQPARHSEPQS